MKKRKSEQEHLRHFLIKRVTRKLHVVVVQNNAIQKSVRYVQNCLFVFLVCIFGVLVAVTV